MLVVNAQAARTFVLHRLASALILFAGLQAKRCALMILRALLGLGTVKGVQHDRRQSRRCCQLYPAA